LILTGTIGFHLIENWPLFDSLYFTVVTLTTIGYGDLVPQSRPGKVFTMVLALSGIFTLFYASAEVIRAVIGGEIKDMLGRRRMDQNLAAMNNHLIVCGLGRMGRLVCQEFANAGVPFVAIDHGAREVTSFNVPGGIALEGDATSDAVLARAGVQRARALVAVVGSDADNLYITMSARLLNEKLFIVARAENESAEQKLVRAGANRVVSPYVIGGTRVAQAVLRPAVVDFIELATRTQHLELQIEETAIAPRSRLAGMTLKDSRIRQDMGIILVAIKKPAGQMLFNPSPEATLEARDILITLGNRAQLDELQRIATA
jgi:voltage-gated potassium channel